MDPVAITVTRSDPVGASSFQAALSRLSKLPLWQAMLAVLAGQVTATEACQALGMSRSGFYQRLTRVLTAIVWALTDRPAGRPRRGVPRSWPHALERLEGLRAENAHLKQELRQERLARLARRKKLHTCGQPNLAACLDWVELKLGRWSISLVLVMDEATRFITAWRLAFSPTTQVALAALRDALRAYGRPLQQPEHIEQVEWRREGDGLILNFTNRHGGRARRALQLAG